MDENVEPINCERCARADIVGVTGMSVQRFRMKEILTELKQRGVFTVVGGPLGHRPGGLLRGAGRRDLRRRGRGDLAPSSWASGSTELHQYRYEQAEKSDMTKVPTPRFDLLKMNTVRLRQPPVLARLPVPVRVLRYHRHLRPPAPDRRLGSRSSRSWMRSAEDRLRIVFIVDDNLIGNKKAIKHVLRDVIGLAGRNGYPLDLLHRGFDRPGRRRRAARSDGRSQLHRDLRWDREPQRGIPPRDQEIPERPVGREPAGEGPPDPGRRDGGLVRHDHGVRQRRRAIFDRPDRVHPERPGSRSR